MVYTAAFLQSTTVWHREGLFMGMHWVWWLFWIVTLVIIAWAFVRLFADRRQARLRELKRRQAEEALRERFSRGEIREDELIERLTALQTRP